MNTILQILKFSFDEHRKIFFPLFLLSKTNLEELSNELEKIGKT